MIRQQIEQRMKRKNRIVATTLALLIFVMFIISMNTGSIRLSPIEVLYVLFGQGTDQQQLILYDFRLPRIIIAILVGCGLAVSGAVLQGITRNPLADPGIIGINAGAGLMVLLFVTLTPLDKLNSFFMMPLMAFIGAGVAAIIIYVLSYKKMKALQRHAYF